MKSKKTNFIFCGLYAIFVGCLLVIAAGCENTNNKLSPKEEISILKQEKAQLKDQIKQSEEKAEQLKKQIQVLSDLESEVRFEHLYDIQKIKITRYTGFYDKDRDGKKEKLIVYIQPIDEQGDIVKATGSVDVQLWDLNKQDGEALLGEWRVGPDELKKLWFATLITINYRLPFDAGGIVDKAEGPLTVKVTFTDYLTGKVFNEQKVVEPH